MYDGKQVLTITNKIKSADIGGLGKELTERIGTGNYDNDRTKFNLEFVPLCSTNLAVVVVIVHFIFCHLL